MAESSGKLVCPSCSREHPPHLRYCTQCGSRLPKPERSKVDESATPSGVARGIEPPPDALDAEPSYTRGHAVEESEEQTVIEQVLPIYHGALPPEDALAKTAVESKPVHVGRPRPWVVGMLIVLAVVLPPTGIISAIVMAFHRQYRAAALPALLASALGGSLWGWGFWANAKQHMYDEPHAAIQAYIDAQDWAKASTGRYVPLLEMQVLGFLPPEFPEGRLLDFTINEHVLGPTGYVVEARPEPEDAALYGIESLWTDQTGVIRRSSRDGPRFAE